MSDPLADFEEALDFYRDRCHEYADRANDEQFGDGSPVTTDRVYGSETKARAEVVRLYRASGVRVSEDAGLREAAREMVIAASAKPDVDESDHPEGLTKEQVERRWLDWDIRQDRALAALDAALRSEDAAPRCDLACGHHGDHWLADPDEDAAPQPEPHEAPHPDCPFCASGIYVDRTPTAHPSPADAPSVAPQSLRDAAQEVVEAWDNCTDPRVNNRLTLVDYDRIHDDAIDALRAALDAPALTVEPDLTSAWRPADRTVLAAMAPIVDGLCSGCGTKPTRETGSCRCLFRIDDVIRGKA
jgi:hypothetical protein